MNDKVKITVHRGSHQIGGCCTEISYLSSRIMIDFGCPLPDEEHSQLNIEGVTYGDTVCDGIFLTHYHGDHVGEMNRVLSDIPIYASKCMIDIMAAYREHMGDDYLKGISLDRMRTISIGEPVTVGEFRISAIRSDHSAAEAYMYLIEVGGKRILHTGDFRLHGRKRKNIFRQIETLGHIDLLITEGTMLSRSGDSHWTEQDVTKRFEECIQKYKYCFVITSSGNLDRIQSISEAVPRGKYFLMDTFQRKLLDIANNYGEYNFNKPVVYGNNLREKMQRLGFVMLIRANRIGKSLLKEYAYRFPHDTCLIYSMWSGYLEFGNMQDLYDSADCDKRIIHSSGHVVIQDLNEFMKAVNPDRIMVIHTDSAEMDNIELSDRIIKMQDGIDVYL